MPPPSEYDPTQSDSELTRDAPLPAPDLFAENGDATNRTPKTSERVDEDVVRVPGFEIQGELARGGMGVVYTAVDPVFGRDVAIKVLLPGLQHVPEAITRFAAEARISGRLQHPGVPPVHHLGTLSDGRPFLVMKLIRGQTLAATIKARRDAANSADSPDLIRVFEQICLAVGYAHQQGIVHRDLKPQNVMVGEFGEVQVMDWGLAKELRTADTGRPAASGDQSHPPCSTSASGPPNSTMFANTVTQPGSVLGTPAYMPPEQARGEIENVDARSDVFALGGILCAILTGQPPYAVRSGREAIRRAAAGDLTEGFALLDSCEADPELIDLTKECLSRHPPNRPADGGAVARRVNEYRQGVERRLHEVEAARTAAEVRALELRKRKRVQIALAGALALLVFTGGAFAWWEDRQAERAKLRQAEFDADQARVDGERKAEALRQQAEAETRERIEHDRLSRNADAIEMLLGQAETALRSDQTATTASALDQAARRFEDGGGDHLHRRYDRLRRDLTLLRELDCLDDLRWTTGGRRFLDEKADAQLPALFKGIGIDPNETPPEIAAALVQSPIRERLLAALDRWFLATRSRELLAILRAADPDHFRNEIRAALAGGNRDRIQKLAALPDARTQPPRFAIILGRMPDLTFPLRQDILLDTHRKTPNDLSLLMSLGLLYPTGQRPGAANRVGWFRAALAVRPNLLPAWNGLGIALYDLDDLSGAADAFREALRLSPSYITARSNLGSTLHRMGMSDEAIGEYRIGLKYDPEEPSLWYNLGVALVDRGDLTGAVHAFRKSVEYDPSDSRTHFNLGIVLDDLGDQDGAIAAYRKAITFDSEYAPAHNNLGLLLYKRKDFAGAVKCYAEVVRIQPNNALAFHNLGDAYWQLGDVDGAIAAYRAAVRVKPDYALAHYNLGVALLKQGQRIEAFWEYGEAARLDPKRFGFVYKEITPVELAPAPREVEK